MALRPTGSAPAGGGDVLLTRHDVLRSAAAALAIGAIAEPVQAFPLPGMMPAQNAPPAVKELSSAEQVALAEHLKATGATFYGAYWCPFCTLQRQMFGAAGAQALPYVECAEDGVGAAAGVCRSQGVNSYPSWKINGKVYTGLQSLTALQGLSGFDPAVKFPEFVPPGAKPKPKPPPGGFQPPAVTERSSPEQIALATHLKESGAKFFGGSTFCLYLNLCLCLCLCLL